MAVQTFSTVVRPFVFMFQIWKKHSIAIMSWRSHPQLKGFFHCHLSLCQGKQSHHKELRPNEKIQERQDKNGIMMRLTYSWHNGSFIAAHRWPLKFTNTPYKAAKWPRTDSSSQAHGSVHVHAYTQADVAEHKEKQLWTCAHTKICDLLKQF